MRTARVAAQAKINLRLRILARESSGYHTIETIFHRVDLADDIVVRTDVRGRAIDCRGADTGPADRNLAFRAAVAYSAVAGWPSGFAIEVDKRIPVGGGMGGGSADAGAVLRALDAVSLTPLGGPRLRDIGASLGADVAFLTTSDPMALAWGHGDRMIGLPALPSRFVVAVLPPFAVSTADAYRWWDETSAGPQAEAWRKEPSQLADWAAIVRMAENDFDEVVFAHHADLAAIAAQLRAAGAVIAMLSGSGSTVLGVFEAAAPANLSLVGADRTLVTRTATRVAPIAID